MKINSIILSAGYSTRFGDFKPLAKVYDKTFIESVIENLDRVCDSVTVVGGHNYDLLEQHLSKKYKKNVQIIYNKNYDNGMFSSVQAGLTNCIDADWNLIHLVDQPGLPEEFYNEFINKVDRRHNWIQPKYKEKKGHPILINNSLVDMILKEELNSNLREISKSKKFIKKFWDCNYKEVLQDIDTKEDYKELIRGSRYLNDIGNLKV